MCVRASLCVCDCGRVTVFIFFLNLLTCTRHLYIYTICTRSESVSKLAKWFVVLSSNENNPLDYMRQSIVHHNRDCSPTTNTLFTRIQWITIAYAGRFQVNAFFFPEKVPFYSFYLIDVWVSVWFFIYQIEIVRVLWIPWKSKVFYEWRKKTLCKFYPQADFIWTVVKIIF